MKKKCTKFCLITFFIVSIMMLKVTFATSGDTLFTEEEINYINTHKEIFVAGNSELSPVEFYNESTYEYEGIMPDIFREISNISGLTFKYINNQEAWESYARENQVEIVSGVISDDVIFEDVNLKADIIVLKMPIDGMDKNISIGFTGIADDLLLEIVKKSINSIDNLEKQNIVAKNVMKYSKDNEMQYALIGTLISAILFLVILFVLYRKYRKNAMQAKFIDNVTRRGNYQNMEVCFNEMLTEENRCAYCVINIGLDVAHVEEIYGYSELEEILIHSADVLDKYVKNNECFARVYKDSFVIIANYVLDTDISTRIEAVLEEIKNFVKTYNKPYGIDAQAGIYYLNKTDTDLSVAVYSALQARREAKKQGVSIRRCTDSLVSMRRKEKHIEEKVINAFSNNEFATYMQPLIDLKNDRMAALEVLARWDNPQLGLVKPNKFIRILEENKTIDKLDFLMYENACKALVKMKEEDKEIYTIFCNFSRSTIEKNSFFEKVKKIAETYDIPKKYIGIIIADDTIHTSTVNLKNMIDKLKAEGFAVLLDEFGETVNSFKDLQEFQVDYIKISSKLTENLLNERRATFIKGIIDMAHGLNIKVICEDFKTRDNEIVLRKIGCDIVQGSAYYQPIPVEEMKM